MRITAREYSVNYADRLGNPILPDRIALFIIEKRYENEKA